MIQFLILAYVLLLPTEINLLLLFFFVFLNWYLVVQRVKKKEENKKGRHQHWINATHFATNIVFPRSFIFWVLLYVYYLYMDLIIIIILFAQHGLCSYSYSKKYCNNILFLLLFFGCAWKSRIMLIARAISVSVAIFFFSFPLHYHFFLFFFFVSKK